MSSTLSIFEVTQVHDCVACVKLSLKGEVVSGPARREEVVHVAAVRAYHQFPDCLLIVHQ